MKYLMLIISLGVLVIAVYFWTTSQSLFVKIVFSALFLLVAGISIGQFVTDKEEKKLVEEQQLKKEQKEKEHQEKLAAHEEYKNSVHYIPTTFEEKLEKYKAEKSKGFK